MPTSFPAPDPTPMDSFQTLTRLAQHPFDLTAPGALTAQRVLDLQAQACGFQLLYGTQRVNQETLAALAGLAKETQAVERMAQLMAGARANRIEGWPSEDRQVLHHATRDLFSDMPEPPLLTRVRERLAPAEADAARAAREEAVKQMEHLRVFLDDVMMGRITNNRGETFTDLVNVGIGGSDLGPRAVYMAVGPHRLRGRQVHYVSNLDSDDMSRHLAGLNLSRTLVNVVSKSGTTLETLTNETLARRFFREAGLDPAQHFICVTGQGSPMDNPAAYRACFHMFDYIGGRYSVTSMVGGVSLGFAMGYAGFVEFLRGARAMDLASLEPDPLNNLPLLAALLGVWNRSFLGHETLAVLPYSQGLLRFVAHLQQLDMESNGKGVTRLGQEAPYPTGPVVWGEPGTNGQHAFYQLLHQSKTVVPCEFIAFRRCQWNADIEVEGTTSQQKVLANVLAHAMALALGQTHENPNKRFPGNRPSWLMVHDRLTPYSLGSLLAFYENKVAFQGLLWNINSFDQEGVQLGKVLAQRFLSHLQNPTGAQAKADPLGLAMLQAAGMLEDST